MQAVGLQPAGRAVKSCMVGFEAQHQVVDIDFGASLNARLYSARLNKTELTSSGQLRRCERTFTTKTLLVAKRTGTTTGYR